MRIGSLALLLVALVGGPFGCGDREPASTTAPWTDTTLRVGLHSPPLSTDPLAQNEVVTFQTLRHVYEGLTGLDAASGVVPMLAERWESLDELRWRFTLRPARFHDGRRLHADDVVWSLERARRPENEMSSYLIEVESVRALDERTVEIGTRRPYPILLAKLAYVAIQSQSSRDASVPIGTGRYRWTSPVEASAEASAETPTDATPTEAGVVLLEAFDGHWSGRTPPFRRVELRPIPDPGDRVAALLDGTIDLAQHLRPEDATALRGADCCLLVAQPSLHTRYLAMHPERPPFDDPRVRKAVDLALDRQALVDTLLLGYGTPTRQLVSVNVFGYDPEIAPEARDLEAARRLLAEAGYPDGLDVTLETSRLGPADAIAAQLADAGIRVRVEILEWPTMVDRLAARDVSFYVGGILAVSADASDVFDSMLHTPALDLGYGRNNAVGLSDPELDELIEASGSLGDMSRRREVLRQAMSTTLDRRVYLGLFSRDALFGARRDLRWSPRLDGFLFAWDISPPAEPERRPAPTRAR